MRAKPAVLTVWLSIMLGWFIPTIMMLEAVVQPGELFLGLHFLQWIGILLGFFIGCVVATFAGERLALKAFLNKVKQETFSFIGLGLAMITFSLNVIFPRVIPATLFTHVTPQGYTITPSDIASMSFSIVISFVLVIIAVLFLIKIHHSKT